MRAPEFWSRSNASARFAASVLAPLGWIYAASVALKRDCAKPWRSKARVICVGNLVAGGSGKTPVAIALGRALLAKGANVFFLTRGYGGRLAGPLIVRPGEHHAAGVGDEPLLLATVAPTIVAADRKAGAMLADAQGADIIVMDDGHQNFTLKKDLSLVVVDAERGFGNGKVIPAGPLREPVAHGLARADAVVRVGDGVHELQGFHGTLLLAHIIPVSTLSSKRVVAFAGIGNPPRFFRTLGAMGAELIAGHAFPDHHTFTRTEIAWLKAEARAAQAVLVTTEKDFVRLPDSDRAGIVSVPVRVHFDDSQALERLLDRALGRS